MWQKFLDIWPLVWKSTHRRELQEMKDEYISIMNNKMVVDIQMTKVFDELVKRSGVKLKLITLDNGFQAWEIDENEKV